MASPSSPPQIFCAAAQKAKQARAATISSDHDFIHRRAAEDIVDRLETVLKRFERVLITGTGAELVTDAITDAADVGEITLLPSTDAEQHKLPYPDGAFDAVISIMTLHRANDVVAGLREARRALEADGLFIGVFPGERTLHELREVLQTAESSVTGKVAPRVHPCIAVKDAGALLQAAGFALPVSDLDRVQISYSSFYKLLADLRGTGETNALAAAPKGAMRRDVLAAALEMYTDRHADQDGGLKATVDLVTVTGWAPHPAQPKPLKPGSATASLADAIRETPGPKS